MAARREFEEGGYVETSVSDIVRIAGGSQASFYSYFTSKDDALGVLIDELTDDLFAAATQPVVGTTTPFENLSRRFVNSCTPTATERRCC